jgi:hypothetical protein
MNDGLIDLADPDVWLLGDVSDRCVVGFVHGFMCDSTSFVIGFDSPYTIPTRQPLGYRALLLICLVPNKTQRKSQ